MRPAEKTLESGARRIYQRPIHPEGPGIIRRRREDQTQSPESGFCVGRDPPCRGLPPRPRAFMPPERVKYPKIGRYARTFYEEGVEDRGRRSGSFHGTGAEFGVEQLH